MKWLNDLKTRTKLLGIFTAMAVMVILLGVLSISGITKMKQAVERLYTDKFALAIDMRRMSDELTDIKLATLLIVNEPDASKREYIFVDAKDDEKEIERIIKKYGAVDFTPEGRKVFEELKQAWKAYNESRLNTYNWMLKGNLEKAKHTALTDGIVKFDVIDETMERLLEIQNEEGKELHREAGNEYRFQRNAAIGVAIIAILTAFSLGIILSNMIASPLQKGVNLAEAIAGGDLTNRLNRETIERNDEVGKLLTAMGNMAEKLKSIMADIKSTADNVAAAGNQLSASSEQMSVNSKSSASAVEEMTATMHEMSANIQSVAKNTQKQAASVTETSSSVEQLVASIQRVAENVKRLISTAQGSKEAASTGSVAVEKSAAVMSEIATVIQQSAQTIMGLGSRTKEMSKIVGVIDDIADQTNLLALNAAIEAARAGEQGRGFAVVAGEIRGLAEGTAKSTREITALIHSVSNETQTAVDTMARSTDIVEQGLVANREVTQALEGIKSAVEEVLKYSNEIGTATQEQSSGSEQIGRTMVDLDKITREISLATEEQSSGTGQVVEAIEGVREMVQQGASSAVEFASSAEQLRKQSEGLRVLVGKFSIDETPLRGAST